MPGSDNADDTHPLSLPLTCLSQSIVVLQKLRMKSRTLSRCQGSEDLRYGPNTPLHMIGGGGMDQTHPCTSTEEKCTRD